MVPECHLSSLRGATATLNCVTSVCKNVLIPHKNKKRWELTEQQQSENKLMSFERVVVEQTLAGLKRYRILSARLRIHILDLYNIILSVGAGWWNFYLADFS